MWKEKLWGWSSLGQNPFTWAELKQKPAFQLFIPDPVPRFSLGLVIHLTEQAACWFDFMQLKSFWMLELCSVLDFFFFFLNLKLGTQPQFL